MDTRKKILESARREFAQHGLAGARVDRIARLARVNKAMIYYHFHSKDKLYGAVIDYHFARLGNYMYDLASKKLAIDELFLEMARMYSEMVEKNREFGPIFLREIASGGRRIQEALKRATAERGLTTTLINMMEKGIRDGSVRKIDCRQAIISFIGMNLFYFIMAPVINSIWGIEDSRKFRRERPPAVVDLFLHGIKEK